MEVRHLVVLLQLLLLQLKLHLLHQVIYTPGQCTWYVYDRVGGKIGSTWGNANNWASAKIIGIWVHCK